MSTGLKKISVLFGIMAVVVAAGVLITWGVNRGGEPAQEEEFQVVTSFYPIYIGAMNVIGDTQGVALSNLTENQGGCLHDYQLTAADMKKLEGADVFIINGGGMEVFLEQIKRAYPELTIIDTSVGIETEEGNAHYWIDPQRYRLQLSNIEKGLAALDKAHKAEYAKNRETYEKQIEQVEEKMLAAMKSFPKERAVLFHDAFYYLAKRLDIEVVYSIELEEDTSLNTGEIAKIVDRARQEKVRLLFTEKQFSESIPAGISRETGADICIVDTLVTGEMKEDAYLRGMEQNIEEITRCLSLLEQEG